jgi:hypothetical protein
MSQPNLLYGNTNLSDNNNISEDQKILQIRDYLDKNNYSEISEFINEYGLPETKAARSLLIDLASDFNGLLTDKEANATEKQAAVRFSRSFLKAYRKRKGGQSALDLSDSSLQQLANNYLEQQLKTKTVISKSLVERCQTVFRDSSLSPTQYLVIYAFAHNLQSEVNAPEAPQEVDIVYHLVQKTNSNNYRTLCNNQFAEYLPEENQDPILVRETLNSGQIKARIVSENNHHELCKHCLLTNEDYQKQSNPQEQRLLEDEPIEQFYLRIISSRPVTVEQYLSAPSDRLEEKAAIFGSSHQQLLKSEYLEEQLIYELAWQNISDFFASCYSSKKGQYLADQQQVSPDNQSLLTKYQQIIETFEKAEKLIADLQCYDYSVFSKLPKIPCRS